MAGKRDLQGRVEGVNDNGVKINGTWFNYSKFFKGEKSPAKGVAVSAVIGDYQGRDYLNELTVIGSALPNGGGNSPETGSTGSATGYYGGGRGADTNERIARQVALKAAIDFNSGTSGINEADVVATARIFERFLAEPYGEGDVEAAA